jgi:hypothetical protein
MSEIAHRRTWVAMLLFAIGALLIGHSLFSNLTHADPPELRFTLTIDRAGSAFETRAEGTRKVYGKQFYFEGERVTLLGEIEGEHVIVKGTVRSGKDSGQSREFKAEGVIAENRMITSVVTDKGAKIGRIELRF